jgi:hypothetical protein
VWLLVVSISVCSLTVVVRAKAAVQYIILLALQLSSCDNSVVVLVTCCALKSL